VVIKFRDKDESQKIGSRHASWDWAAWRRCLNHLLTAPTSLLQPSNLDHFQFGRDQLKDFADIFADEPKRRRSRSL
jgi:hypothetical protein